MLGARADKDMHPTDMELAGFLGGSLPGRARRRVETHLSGCNKCLVSVICAYDSVSSSAHGGGKNRKKKDLFNKFNLYLLFSAASFILSFMTPRYFIQLLVATLLFGIKWVVDSKSARMLVMINEAWKREGCAGTQEAGRISDRRDSERIVP